mmetsp:Transcript_14889/g.32333  ORF Transcript_14889/g.32333 Transcript_14889/m.32333 type:complete len:596 (+) Transcript_14889:120-1907(+)|eukprot:CAMPEP_0172328860 /NCGR_PEP_ID=MMETSP1058-20130122/60573_1 /TAXON_ID=83371 /ORGANISM="Detonula confervacea, Strain CCMP 353" /LENGTH=595 /DNA_ID=CAMNT_0013045993 /DNA_START=56 /DNA_END=1843 /DNA_ORIENTATION=+
MLTLRRYLTISSKARLSTTTSLIARDGAAARTFTASSHLSSGNLADVCNLNVVSSHYPPLMDSSNFTPVPEFVSSGWKDAALANKVAIRDGSTGETRTFSDYHDRMHRIAAALKTEYNLKPDETVALLSTNNVDYLPICLAVGLCGSKVTPINPLSTANDLSKILVPSKSKILFTHANFLPVALKAAHAAPCVEHVVVIPDVRSDTDIPEGTESLERLAMYDNVVDNVHYEVKDVGNHPWLLPYSSGTTGLPKGCMLSHANIVANLLQLNEIEEGVFPQDHKLISPLPFFHIYGMLASLLYCGWRGQELITMSDKFDLEKFCQLVQEHEPQRAHLVPPIILGLAKHPAVDNYDMKKLNMIVSAAAPLGKDTEDAVRNRLGLDVKQAWGMSELSPVGTIIHDSNQKTGSIGQLVPSTYGKIIDAETGKSLGPDEPGELCIKGPQVMMGYFNDIEKTKECLSDDGWLRTGDLACYDEDGFFYITDRLKELIKVRGYQVAPAELEELILHNEHVQDVAVVQIPDEVSGELPRAYVVLKPSADPKEATEEYLKEWVKERVTPHKRIHGGVKFVEQIPKSASGKILRRILRDEAKKEFES